MKFSMEFILIYLDSQTNKNVIECKQILKQSLSTCELLTRNLFFLTCDFCSEPDGWFYFLLGKFS
jgi:hypothetical protein